MTTWNEIRQQLADDREAGVQRVSLLWLKSALASKGWAALTHGTYSPSLQYDRTWIFGQGVGTSPNPFRN